MRATGQISATPEELLVSNSSYYRYLDLIVCPTTPQELLYFAPAIDGESSGTAKFKCKGVWDFLRRFI